MPGSVSADSASARAIPKSATFTRPSWVTRMLPGLMSRWTNPRAWAAASARAAWATIRAAGARRQGAAAPEDRGQILALDELHDDERPDRVRAVVVDRDDVRVVQRRGRLGLVPEAVDEVGVARRTRVAGP